MRLTAAFLVNFKDVPQSSQSSSTPQADALKSAKGVRRSAFGLTSCSPASGSRFRKTARQTFRVNSLEPASTLTFSVRRQPGPKSSDMKSCRIRRSRKSLRGVCDRVQSLKNVDCDDMGLGRKLAEYVIGTEEQTMPYVLQNYASPHMERYLVHRSSRSPGQELVNELTKNE